MASANQNYVTARALSAGFLTLPEHLFVQPSVEGARNTVPSLSFLIQHLSPTTKKLTRIVFDLGLRKNLKQYSVPLQKHLESRHPLITEPDVSDSLKEGGLTPEDIDYVILSHVHWDHVGTPKDFGKSWFVVGNGSLALLESGRNPPPAESHSYFEADMLPAERATELPGVKESGVAIVFFEHPGDAHKAVDRVNGIKVDGKLLKVELVDGAGVKKGGLFSDVKWQKFGPLPNVIDVFSDGSVYLVDSPGHLEGHLNLLARLAPGKFLYLAGDACHDRRIMRGELEIGTWKNMHGEECCIHVDRAATEKTIELIVGLEKMDGVEVVLAHDIEWLNEEGNREWFWPGKM
jgi:glyoxylase-like metal-dependent hydrolase (beta-lactamase superfamily II)